MIIALIGPSGVGKTSIANKLTTWDKNLREVVSHTTRKNRANEVDGVHYNFVTKENFKMMEANEQFIETNEYKGEYYGVAFSALKDVTVNRKVPVVIVDINGADALVAKYGNDVLTFFIEPPSMEELEKRLKKRKADPEEIAERLKIAEDELPHAFKYSFRITNDVLKTAATRILSTIHDRAAY